MDYFVVKFIYQYIIFSYSYDLTNTLQHNQTEIRQTEVQSNALNQDPSTVKLMGARTKPCSKFLWNEFLLKPIIKKISSQWVVNLIHGYLAQSNILFCFFIVIF